MALSQEDPGIQGVGLANGGFLFNSTGGGDAITIHKSI